MKFLGFFKRSFNFPGDGTFLPETAAPFVDPNFVGILKKQPHVGSINVISHFTYIQLIFYGKACKM